MGGSRTETEVILPEVKPKGKEESAPVSKRLFAGQLGPIIEVKEEEVSRLVPSARELRDRAEANEPARDFVAALRMETEVRILAEIKRRSPSAGPIRPGVEAEEIARAYSEGGAAALSVLTDKQFFDGSLAALEGARAAVDLPLLRKDFVIDPVQVWEARAAGADAILLIVRILDDAELADLQALAHDLGMAALIEIHDPYELERAMNADSPLIGINNRDLTTFVTDLALTESLAPMVGPEVTLVGESGIRNAEDVRRMGAVGVDAVLVGESLMRQEDIVAATAALRGLPRDPAIRGSR